jgi:hypothetical protein
MKQAAFAIFLAIALAGCAKFSLVEPTRTVIGDFYSVEPQVRWNSSKTGKYEIWTVDGLGLQRLQFVSGIEDNESLYKGRKEYEKLIFRKSMTASEITDLIVDSLTADGHRKIESKNFKPNQFGSYSGFRFEMSLVNKEGLEYEGLVAGSIIGGKLYLISYTGTRAYYFSKYKSEVERIIQSIKMQG